MKDDIKIAISRISYYKVMGIRPNFSQLAKEIGVDRHTLSDIPSFKNIFIVGPSYRTKDKLKYFNEDE